jgi:hypothetical protein
MKNKINTLAYDWEHEKIKNHQVSIQYRSITAIGYFNNIREKYQYLIL